MIPIFDLDSLDRGEEFPKRFFVALCAGSPLMVDDLDLFKPSEPLQHRPNDFVCTGEW